MERLLLKSKTRQATIQALGELAALNYSGILELSLANCKMKAEIVPFLQALSKNNTMKKIDISGNAMGDVGCQYLGSSLHYNKVSTQYSVLGIC